MQRRAQISRPAVKTAAKSSTVVRKPAAQAGRQVGCASGRCDSPAPSYEPGPICSPTPSCNDHHSHDKHSHKDRRSHDHHQKKPCNPETITFDCDCTPVHLPCLDLDNQRDIDSLEEALGTIEEIEDCVRTKCPAGGSSTVTVEIVLPEREPTRNGGLYTQVRVFKVTACDGAACGNSTATFEKIVTYTINDRTGPVIIISPHISTYANQLCRPGHQEDDCECIDLGCNPTEAEIKRALGTATVDRCGKLYEPETTREQSDGCYKWKTRTWCAKDECGNKSTACRTVRWSDDTIKPVIVLRPRPAEFIRLFPDVDLTNDTYDLGCNPEDRVNAQWPTLDAIINEALGFAAAEDLCGAPIRVRDGPLVGTCCFFSKTRTFSSTDACGNKSIRKTVTVTYKQDREGPLIQCPPDKYLPDCDIDEEDVWDLFENPDIFDACDGDIDADSDQVTVVRSGPETDDDGNTVYTQTWTAVDSCGNESDEVTQTITVASCDSPTELAVNCGPHQTGECDSVPTADNFRPITLADLVGFPTAPFSAFEVDYSLIRSRNSAPNATEYYRTVTVSYPKINPQYVTECVQKIFVTACEDETPGGCSQSFWACHPELWDAINDEIAQAAGFGAEVNFWTYIGPTVTPIVGLEDLTMFEAVALTGGNCRALIRQGVAALLNAAAFPDTYNFPGATTDVTSLKELIRLTLAANNGQGCATLANTLDQANGQAHGNANDGTICLQIDGVIIPPTYPPHTKPPHHLKLAPKKAVAPAKKQAAPLKKAVVPKKAAAPVAKKVVVPVKKAVAPVKTVAAPAKKAVPKKTVAPVRKATAPVPKKVVVKAGPLGQRVAQVAVRKSFAPSNV